MLKSNPRIALVIGIVLLVVGGFMQFTGGAPKADKDVVALCRQEMDKRGAPQDLADKCTEQAFASMITAKDAQSAAQSVSAANRKEVGGNFVSMFLLGVGIVLFIAGLLGMRTKRKAPTA